MPGRWGIHPFPVPVPGLESPGFSVPCGSGVVSEGWRGLRVLDAAPCSAGGKTPRLHEGLAAGGPAEGQGSAKRARAKQALGERELGGGLGRLRASNPSFSQVLHQQMEQLEEAVAQQEERDLLARRRGFCYWLQ